MAFEVFYRLTLAYDGGQYQGWQSQLNGKGVQDVLGASFERVFGQSVSIVAASRTDSGVSAFGQVARLRCSFGLDPEKLKIVLNRALPSNITIVQCSSCGPDFHPQANVAQKTYLYRIFKYKPRFDELDFGWICPFPERIDWVKFERSFKVFQGEHDFRAFCKIDLGETPQTRRVISSIVLDQSSDGIVEAKVCGPGFLRYQIRRMVGAAFMVASKKDFDQSHLIQSLKSGEKLPAQIDFSMAPEGLCLEKIEYKK